MEIDPYNLGNPVYRKDQVITLDDLRNITNELVETVSQYKLNSEESDRLDIALATLYNLYEWLKLGKPAGQGPMEEI